MEWSGTTTWSDRCGEGVSMKKHGFGFLLEHRINWLKNKSKEKVGMDGKGKGGRRTFSMSN